MPERRSSDDARATRRRCSLGTVALIVCLSASATAAPRPRLLREAVHVTPGITCLDEEALREQVRAWLDADSVDGDLRVEVDGSSEDARVASFRMWRGDRLIAQRRFSPGPAQCAQLHAVLGLAVALALKVSLRDELLGDLGSPPSGKWSLGAGAIGAWKVLPGEAWGAVIWLERALPEHFAAHLGLSGLAGLDETFDRVAGKFSTAQVALDLMLCAVPTLGARVRGRLCAGLEAREWFASGSGFAVSKDASFGGLAVSNSLGVSVEVRPSWSLIGTLGLVVPTARTRIAVSDPAGRVVDTYDSAPLGGLISLGGAYEF